MYELKINVTKGTINMPEYISKFIKLRYFGYENISNKMAGKFFEDINEVNVYKDSGIRYSNGDVLKLKSEYYDSELKFVNSTNNNIAFRSTSEYILKINFKTNKIILPKKLIKKIKSDYTHYGRKYYTNKKGDKIIKCRYNINYHQFIYKPYDVTVQIVDMIDKLREDENISDTVILFKDKFSGMFVPLDKNGNNKFIEFRGMIFKKTKKKGYVNIKTGKVIDKYYDGDEKPMVKLLKAELYNLH